MVHTTTKPRSQNRDHFDPSAAPRGLLLFKIGATRMAARLAHAKGNGHRANNLLQKAIVYASHLPDETEAMEWERELVQLGDQWRGQR